jgi:hypothetical protein
MLYKTWFHCRRRFKEERKVSNFVLSAEEEKETKNSYFNVNARAKKLHLNLDELR